MAKKLSELRKGDKVYLLSNYDIEETVIWEDADMNRNSSFPYHCDVKWVRPSDGCHMTTDVHGDTTNSFNGRWFFTDPKEVGQRLVNELKGLISIREKEVEATMSNIRKYKERLSELERRLNQASINQLEGGRIEEENPKTCSRHLR